MLFVLTGDIQTGKTRWLANVIDELNRDGVPCAGVLAPGIWRECGTGDPAAAPSYEKLGIENVLLPQEEHLLFALRRDLASQDETGRCSVSGDATRLLEEAARERLAAAKVAGYSDAGGAKSADGAARANGAAGRGAVSQGAVSQSEAAKLGWAIADDAIDKVNAHFDELASGVVRSDSVAAHSDAPSLAGGIFEPDAAGLLVVDELGQLELLRGRGLSSAVALLQAGPSARFPHALVIVREWLLERAEELFFGAWPERAVVTAGDDTRCALRRAFGLTD